MSYEDLQGSFDALIVWDRRKALLGAAYLLCPNPFEELAKVLPNVSSASLEGVGALSWEYVEVKEIKDFLDAYEGRFWIGHPAWLAFEHWRQELWFRRNCAEKAAFPESWYPWAYPAFAATAINLREEGKNPDPYTWTYRLFEVLVMTFKAPIRSVYLGPEPGETEGIHPSPGESLSEFLNRARQYYAQVTEKYQSRQIPNAHPPTWRTWQRDLLLYAMHHLLGLSYAETAEKAEEMRHQGGELSRYLDQGRRAPYLAEGEPEAPYAVLSQDEVAKAIARVNKHLRLS